MDKQKYIEKIIKEFEKYWKNKKRTLCKKCDTHVCGICSRNFQIAFLRRKLYTQYKQIQELKKPKIGLYADENTVRIKKLEKQIQEKDEKLKKLDNFFKRMCKECPCENDCKNNRLDNFKCEYEELKNKINSTE